MRLCGLYSQVKLYTSELQPTASIALTHTLIILGARSSGGPSREISNGHRYRSRVYVEYQIGAPRGASYQKRTLGTGQTSPFCVDYIKLLTSEFSSPSTSIPRRVLCSLLEFRCQSNAALSRRGNPGVSLSKWPELVARSEPVVVAITEDTGDATRNVSLRELGGE
jgi:hypothetical protein